ncbi:MAG TPA: glucuronate isomerase [Paludibacteraceae bacterium]|jgi:glucuronate isomerase|nr:glucuronate isomerase [Paludibacteraceae bacterium]OPZ02879.1 MAG: Uronate isomerase [Bacteroidetes bacterium ADurb.BinA395]MBP8966094.1 glucuronate isomerase [Paludibacteraceae bacterium]HOF99185.1 glucuronate isomerase [Paludibacteraceae bacterium]HOL29889.1 glucuronate isomerase [Paludibacteraceae bacterium]
MQSFINDDFLLQSDAAKELYHQHAEHQPIIDYHCHLNPEYIANDRQFDNLGQIWLEGDHYKWRAMRSNGIDEKYCTGKDTSDWEKFEKWAETVPYTMRNPLYHWTHLELKQAFGVDKLLSPATAKEIFDECTAKLRTKEYSARGLMKKFNVEVVCTTDDPVDSLNYHIALKQEGFGIKVLPAWRPDKAMAVENPVEYRKYVEKLSEVSGVTIRKFDDLLQALRVRHDFFADLGCKLSDHGIEEFYAEKWSKSEIEVIFNKVYGGKELTQEEIRKFKSAMLYEGAVMDWEKGWTQQFHYGAIRNNNSRMMKQLGPDTGFDSIGDFTVAKAMSAFFDSLDVSGKLTKTIIYNLNPRDNDLVATMIGNFQDGSVPGKMQFGAAWWFLDQKSGIEAQLNSLSNLGLLSRFVGMLTDSRSFLSYPRHEYFRRILCNLIGNDVENGLLPASEMDFLGKMVENISYFNAKNFFEF